MLKIDDTYKYKNAQLHTTTKIKFGDNLQQKQTITIQTTKNAGLATYNVPKHT